MKKTAQWALACMVAVCLIMMTRGAYQAGPVWAQSRDKMVQGKVFDANGGFLSGAIVYLEDVRTLDVRSYITEKDGVYRFEQLSRNDDYKIWAERDGKKSAVKIISSFDSKKVYYINLHIGGGQ